MKIKTIIASVSAALLVVAVVAAASWASHVPDDTVCQQVRIVLCDSAAHRFVSTNELLRTLDRSGLDIEGQRMDHISCHTIEEALLQHDMVRTAECYKSPSGTVFIDVTQRVPLLYVSTADEKYYVDTDRRVMPARSSVQIDVPVFKGRITQEKATTEYYDFARWLAQDDYWQTRITQVHVQNPSYIVLTQQPVEGRIVLGELKNYEDKLQRLRKLYVEGLDKIGYKPYKEYDLRFAGQVVGRM